MDFYLVIHTNIINNDIITCIELINLQNKKRYIKFPRNNEELYIHDFYGDVYIKYKKKILINISENQFFNILNSSIDTMMNIIDFLKHFDFIEWYI